MRKILYILLAASMLFGGCGDQGNIAAEKAIINNQPQNTYKKMDEKEIEEIVFSWFQNNHYMYEPTDQYTCECWITDTLYGKKAYFPILSYKNECQSLIYFAFIEETGELYLHYADNIYIPVNRVKILDYSKSEKKATAMMKKVFDKKKAEKMAYCDTIERDGIEYYVYGEFESSELQSVFLVDINTEEIYKWDLTEDKLNKSLSAKDIKSAMQKTDSRVKKVKDRLNGELYKDYYDGDILMFRYFENGTEQESFTAYWLYYDEQGKLIYADITHYRGAAYSIYFYNDELLHVEVGPFSYEDDLSINGDMADVKDVIKKDSHYAFVLEDNALCLEYAYK